MFRTFHPRDKKGMPQKRRSQITGKTSNFLGRRYFVPRELLGNFCKKYGVLGYQTFARTKWTCSAIRRNWRTGYEETEGSGDSRTWTRYRKFISRVVLILSVSNSDYYWWTNHFVSIPWAATGGAVYWKRGWGRIALWWNQASCLKLRLRKTFLDLSYFPEWNVLGFLLWWNFFWIRSLLFKWSCCVMKHYRQACCIVHLLGSKWIVFFVAVGLLGGWYEKNQNLSYCIFLDRLQILLQWGTLVYEKLATFCTVNWFFWPTHRNAGDLMRLYRARWFHRIYPGTCGHCDCRKSSFSRLTA